MKEKENAATQASKFNFSQTQTGWLRDSAGGSSSGVCPQCGGENGLDRGGDTDRRLTPVFKCSNCNWQEYPQGATETTNRHGLV